MGFAGRFGKPSLTERSSGAPELAAATLAHDRRPGAPLDWTAAAAKIGAPARSPDGSDMNDILALDGASLLAAFRNRALSPVEVVDAVLAGIERHNPVVNAFNIVDAEGARTAARRSEARWAKRAPLGPVDGLPLTIKDNIIWAGHPARRGSRTSSTDPVAESAPSVDRLLEAGAVPIGKTTLPEFGWKGIGDSPLTGITRNPWDTRVTHRRLVGGRRGGGRPQSRRPASRHRRRRLDPHPGGLLRRLRHQAELRARAGLSALPLRDPVACRPALAHRARRGARAHRGLARPTRAT